MNLSMYACTCVCAWICTCVQAYICLEGCSISDLEIFKHTYEHLSKCICIQNLCSQTSAVVCTDYEQLKHIDSQGMKYIKN